MEAIKLEATSRELGKKATKAVRNRGNVPCVLYGHDLAPVHFEVAELSLRPLVYTSETHVVDLNIGDESWSCILRSIDFNPVTDAPSHVDFQLLHAGEMIRVMVPIKFNGVPVGQIEGGVTQIVLTELETECLPKDIRGHIDVDISHMQIGDTMHVSDLDLDPLVILTNENQTMVTVAGAVQEIEEEVDELLGEGEEGADDSEGADGEGDDESSEG